MGVGCENKASSHPIAPHLIPSHPISSHPTPSHPIAPHVIPPDPTSSHLTLPHAISSHPTLSHPGLMPSHSSPSIPSKNSIIIQWRAGDAVSTSLAFVFPPSCSLGDKQTSLQRGPSGSQIQVTVPLGDAHLHQAMVLAGWELSPCTVLPIPTPHTGPTV